MGKLALKIYKALYGLDIEAQNTELIRLRLENKRLSELLRSTSREYNSLNEKYKKKKESIKTEYELATDELRQLKEKYETIVIEKENLEKNISLANEKMAGEIEQQQKVIEELKSEKENLDKELTALNELYIKEKEGNTLLSEKITSLENEIANIAFKAEEDISDEEEQTIKETITEEIEEVLQKAPKIEDTISTENTPPIEETKEDKEVGNNISTDEISDNEDIATKIDDEDTRKENMQKEILSITQNFEYIRITTTIGNQYIYQSKHFRLSTGLFDWGIEGKEIITDENLYLENSLVSKMEGLNTPFIGDELECNFEDEDSSSAIADALLIAICTYQPIQVNYHDKNGRTTQKNLFHVTFKPLTNKFKLPYKDIFKDMLEEKIDPEQLSALCPHNPEPRNFAIPQIQTLRRFNAFFTTQEGIETLKEGIELAKEADQVELAEVLMSKIQN